MGDMADLVNDDSPWDGLGYSPLDRAEQAVIEAAVALRDVLESPLETGFALPEIGAVCDAVDAYLSLKARGE